MRSKRLAATVALLACVALAAPAWAQLDETLAGLSVSNVSSSGDRVSGTLVNRTSKELKDVVLLVTRSWLWTNERHPGENSPGGSYYFTVKTPVAAGSSLPFSFDLPPPETSASQAGHFEVSIQPTGYTEVYIP